MSTSKRVSRLRAVALAVLFAGIAGAFLIGALYPAQITSTGVGLTQVKTTVFTQTPESGNTAFNWLLALLVGGPAVVAAAVLYGAAEIAGAVRRSSRSSRSDRVNLEVGDEI